MKRLFEDSLHTGFSIDLNTIDEDVIDSSQDKNDRDIVTNHQISNNVQANHSLEIQDFESIVDDLTDSSSLFNIETISDSADSNDIEYGRLSSVENQLSYKSDNQIIDSQDLGNVELNSMEQVSQIGCGCAACCGDNRVMPQDDGTGTEEFNGVSADAVVGGESGKEALMSGYSWNNDGTGLTLDFNFYTSLPSFYSIVGSDLRTGFQAMNANQADAAREVLSVIESYVNINFNEVNSTASADISFGQVSRSNQNVVAHAWYPTGSVVDGDVFLNTNFWGYDSNPEAGDLVYQTLFHEVGHALGLKHSFDTSGDTLNSGEENNNYSVMSYTRSGGNAQSMMMHDIAALQELYGVNTNYNTGNNVYTIEEGGHFTIWDAGGNDTLNGAANSADMTIRLDEGALTEIGSTRIGIAYDAEIENATGGSGNDTIYGNDLDNILLGNNGADTFYGSVGSDTINGGSGTDSVQYNFTVSSFAFNFVSSVTVAITHIAQTWIDTISNIENFIFSDGSYTFQELFESFGETNHFAPELSTQDLNLNAGDTVLASSVITASDADGDTLTYKVWDAGTGTNSGYFELDGTALAAGRAHTLTEAEFGRLNVVGGSAAGNDTLWAHVSDGEKSTSWQSFILTSGSGSSGSSGSSGGSGSSTTNDHAPTVNTSDLNLNAGESALASTAITASDADGNTLTYTVWDAGKDGTSGYFELDGSALTAGRGHTLTAEEFGRLNIVGGSAAGNDTLWTRVSDGATTTSWQSFTLTSGTGGGSGGSGSTTNDHAPTVNTSDLNLNTGESALASTAITASDADGNALTYTVWDSGKDGTSGYFELDGSALTAGRGHTLTAEEFGRLNIVGGSASGDDTLWIRVSDGATTTSWQSFTLTSGAGSGDSGGGSTTNDHAPTVSASHLTLDVGESALASTAITANDADGNALTYTVWDAGSGSNSGYFELDGSALTAGRGHTLTAEEFGRLNIVGGNDAGEDKLWIRVSDGANTTAWKSFNLTNTGSSSFEIGELLEFGSAEQDALNSLYIDDQTSNNVQQVQSQDSFSSGLLPDLETNIITEQIL